MKKADKKVLTEAAILLASVYVSKRMNWNVATGFIGGKVISHFINQKLYSNEKKAQKRICTTS